MKVLYCKLLFIVILSVILIPGTTIAQMFSVEEPERRTRPSTSTLLLGYDYLDMSYRSDANENGVYDFSNPVYRIRLELPGIEIYSGFRSSIGDADVEADTLNYINVGANLSGAMPIVMRPRAGFILPLLISTDYMQVRSSHSGQPEAEQFRQSSVSVGLGAGGYVNLTQRVRIRIQAVPQIGFTVTALGADAGQITSLNTKARLHFDQLFGRFGAVLGYNYSWRRYSGDDRFNYDITSNNVSIGVSF